MVTHWDLSNNIVMGIYSRWTIIRMKVGDPDLKSGCIIDECIHMNFVCIEGLNSPLQECIAVAKVFEA